jgi:hypothetical protein
MAGSEASKAVEKSAPERPDSKLGVSVAGTPEDGQHVTIASDTAFLSLFGTEHPELAEALFGHCMKVLKGNECSDDFAGNDERMFMISAVAEMKPRDTFERMLSVQMAATHVAMVRSGRMLANAVSIEQTNLYYNGYTKLARAYTAQMEALRKHRNGGKQTVTVQYVNVEGGGQAIVGNVEAGGRGRDGK